MSDRTYPLVPLACGPGMARLPMQIYSTAGHWSPFLVGMSATGLRGERLFDLVPVLLRRLVAAAASSAIQ